MSIAVAKSYEDCSICLQLADFQYGFQKIGREETDTFLPSVADRLQLVRDLVPDCNGDLQIKQCPQCATYYLYRTESEFIYGGSEDEQQLRRLTNEAAAEYMKRPGPDETELLNGAADEEPPQV